MNKIRKNTSSETKWNDGILHDRNYFRKKLRFDDTVAEGAELIGRAYDVFGDYASVTSCGISLFDEMKLNEDKENNFKPVTVLGKNLSVPVYIDLSSVGNLKYTNSSGQTIESYQSSLAGKSSISMNYAFFSASLSVDFSSESLSEYDNAYSRIQHTYDVYSLQCDTDILKEFLKKGVISDLAEFEDEEDMDYIFDKYGAYFVSGIVMGGCAIYSASTKRSSTQLNERLEIVAEAAYGGLVGVSASSSNVTSEEIKKFSLNSTIHHHSVGGDLSLYDPFGGATTSIPPTAAETADAKKAFEDWKASVPLHPDLVDFTPQNALTGIWELCDGMAQRKKLKKYFEEVWGPRESAKHQMYSGYIDALVITEGEYLEPPEGYLPINGPLNPQVVTHRSLFIHKSPYEPLGSNPPAVTAMQFMADNKSPGQGWHKLECNVGGVYKTFHLWYRLEAFSAATAIIDIKMAYGEVSTPPLPPVTPFGYTPVLNDKGEVQNTTTHPQTFDIACYKCGTH